MRLPVMALLAGVFLLACAREAPAPSPAAERAPRVEMSARQPRAGRAPLQGREPAPSAVPVAATLDSVASAVDTFESLRARHGEAAVIRETLPGAEGDRIDGWVLFPLDRERRIEVYPDESGKHPALLMVRDGTSWTRADGVRTGLDTKALEELNGRAFEFAGFGWDYGGLVMDWKGGKLANGGRFTGPVRLCDPPSPPEGYPIGDGEFRSDLAIVRANPARVCEFGLSLGAR